MESFFRIDHAPTAAKGPEAEERAPDVALLRAAEQSAAARIRVAESADTSDMTGRLGLRHFGDGNDVAVMVGGSIPLGSRAANRGNIARAKAEQGAAQAELAVAQRDLELQVRQFVADRSLAVAEIGRIEREVIPSAERALALVRAGYARGGTAFTFLEISQAQRSLDEARTRRVELLRRYHLAGARLDRLSGRHLSLVTSEETR